MFVIVLQADNLMGTATKIIWDEVDGILALGKLAEKLGPPVKVDNIWRIESGLINVQVIQCTKWSSELAENADLKLLLDFWLE